MRIILFGCGVYVERVLPAIAESNQIGLIITHAYKNNVGVVEFARQHSIKLLCSYDAREREIMDEVGRASPDLIVACNWRRKLDGYYVHLPKYAAINVHDSFLPNYAGFNATNWAIRNNENYTGVTVHEMDEDLDTGPILLQEKLPIYFTDTAADVDNRILNVFPRLLVEAVRRIAVGERGSVQNVGPRSFYHRITERDARIDWGRSNVDIYNLVRAQSDPYVNAWTTHKEEIVRIVDATLPTDTSYGGTPGRIIENRGEGMVVACGRSNPLCAKQCLEGIIVKTVKDSRGELMSAREYFADCLGTHLE